MISSIKQKLIKTVVLPLLMIGFLIGLAGVLAPVYVSASSGITTFAAADPNDQEKSDIKMDCNNASNLNDNCRIVEYLLNFIDILSAVFAIAVIIVVIVAGIQYSASAGDPQAAAAAKKRITNALLAIVVYACTYGFLQWIVPGGVF